MGRIAGVERPEDGALRAVGWLWMVDGVDQHRETKDIGEKDELLPNIVSHGQSHNWGKEKKSKKKVYEIELRIAEDDNANIMCLPGTWYLGGIRRQQRGRVRIGA